MVKKLNSKIFDIVKLSLSSVLVVASLIIDGSLTDLILCIIATVISGYEIFLGSVKGLFHGEILDENTLMTVAVVTAFILGEYLEGDLIVILFGIGELLENIATDNSRKRIEGLSKLKTDFVNVIVSGEIKRVKAEKVEVGSLTEVRKGDRVAIDGVLCGGESLFDTKAVTGESKPVAIHSGQKVYSGFINLGEATVIKTQVLYKDSTVEKIIELVEGANSKKAKSQKFITEFAKIYTPVVVGIALIIAVIIPLFDGMFFSKWIYKALSFLVISCPCALVISVPLSFFIGIGSLAKIGVLIKGSSYIDELSNVKVAVFDKTGTITKGQFCVSKISTFNGVDKDQVMAVAKALEQKSSHPIAYAVSKYDTQKTYTAKGVKEISGKGLSGKIDKDFYLIGNLSLMKENGVEVNGYVDSAVYLAKNNVLIGIIYVQDQIKESSAKAIKELKKLGIVQTVMLSGDKKEQAESVAKTVGIDRTFYELLPHEKTDKLNGIINEKQGKVLYCGDGINDSPSIASADVGVAMGKIGSEVAIESADMVVLDDDIYKIPLAIRHAKKIKRIVRQNIIFSIFVKVLLMVLAIFVKLPVYVSMAGDVGVMLTVVINSLRNYKLKR